MPLVTFLHHLGSFAVERIIRARILINPFLQVCGTNRRNTINSAYFKPAIPLIKKLDERLIVFHLFNIEKLVTGLHLPLFADIINDRKDVFMMLGAKYIVDKFHGGRAFVG